MKRRLAVLALVAVAAGACSADDWRGVVSETGDSRPRDVTLEQVTSEPPHSELSEVVERTLPSVVHVKVTSVALSESAPPVTGRGEGSGVVIDPAGIILTNYHVVEGAVAVRVAFTDGREPLDGRVIGADPDRDLAVVEVDAGNLQALKLGSSDKLKLGDDVVAMGFPLGLGGPTVTRGIVSGLDREITASAGQPFGPARTENLVGLLQTDAAINPGNSGGALINLRGELVGINTAVAGEAENVGFAIAIDDAMPIIEEILSDPPERQAWLGVQLGTLDSDFAALDLGLPQGTRGAVVVGVVPQSPAASAGIEQGWVVVGANGEGISSADDLIELLTGLDPGETVELELVTPDGDRSMSVTLEQKPFDFVRPDED